MAVYELRNTRPQVRASRSPTGKCLILPDKLAIQTKKSKTKGQNMKKVQKIAKKPSLTCIRGSELSRAEMNELMADSILKGHSRSFIFGRERVLSDVHLPEYGGNFTPGMLLEVCRNVGWVFQEVIEGMKYQEEENRRIRCSTSLLQRRIAAGC